MSEGLGPGEWAAVFLLVTAKDEGRAHLGLGSLFRILALTLKRVSVLQGLRTRHDVV